MTEPIPGIYQWWVFKINTNVSNKIPFTWHSWFHLIGSFLLVLAFHYQWITDWWFTSQHPVFSSFLAGFIWEIFDMVKILYTEWKDLQPDWIPDTEWKWLGELGNSDGFGVLDIIREDLYGWCAGGIFITWIRYVVTLF